MSRTPTPAAAAPVQVLGLGLVLGLAVLGAACERTPHRSGATSSIAAGSRAAGSIAVAGSTPSPASSPASAGTATAQPTAAGSKAAPPTATATTAAKPAKPTTIAAAKPTAAAPAKPTAAAAPAAPAGGKASGADVLAGTHCQLFPTDNYWHADVRSLPVDAHSAQWLSAMGASTRTLHPDFGPSYGEQPVPYGIPITVVSAGHPRVPVTFDYANESDQLSYPLGSDTLIEGGANSGGDRHAIVVTADTCELFETWDTHQTASGWTAGSGAHWSLSSNALRPNGWTSADAAGLPILPGLLRYDEVAAGHVDHAIRFTTTMSDAAHLWPARHDASSHQSSALPPMGARFRLKASFAIGGYGTQTQTVLRAMQTYGLVLADNGSPWYFQGTADNAWPDALIAQLKTIPASAFEAVDTSVLEISAGSGAAR